jgi:hypothetical protein
MRLLTINRNSRQLRRHKRPGFATILIRGKSGVSASLAGGRYEFSYHIKLDFPDRRTGFDGRLQFGASSVHFDYGRSKSNANSCTYTVGGAATDTYSFADRERIGWLWQNGPGDRRS